MMNNNMRKIDINKGEHLSKKVPSVAIHTFFKRFSIPTEKEGFTEIINVTEKPTLSLKSEDLVKLNKSLKEMTLIE